MKRQNGSSKCRKREQPGNGIASPGKRFAEEVLKKVPAVVIAVADVPLSQEQVFNNFRHQAPWKWQGSDDSYSQMGWAAELTPADEWKVDLRLIDRAPNWAGSKFLEIDEPRKLTKRYGLDMALSTEYRVVTISYSFETAGSGTRITLRDEGYLIGTECAFKIAGLWSLALRRLGDLLSGRQDPE